MLSFRHLCRPLVVFLAIALLATTLAADDKSRRERIVKAWGDRASRFSEPQLKALEELVLITDYVDAQLYADLEEVQQEFPIEYPFTEYEAGLKPTDPSRIAMEWHINEDHAPPGMDLPESMQQRLLPILGRRQVNLAPTAPHMESLDSEESEFINHRMFVHHHVIALPKDKKIERFIYKRPDDYDPELEEEPLPLEYEVWSMPIGTRLIHRIDFKMFNDEGDKIIPAPLGVVGRTADSGDNVESKHVELPVLEVFTRRGLFPYELRILEKVKQPNQAERWIAYTSQFAADGSARWIRIKDPSGRRRFVDGPAIDELRSERRFQFSSSYFGREGERFQVHQLAIQSQSCLGCHGATTIATHQLPLLIVEGFEFFSAAAVERIPFPARGQVNRVRGRMRRALMALNSGPISFAPTNPTILAEGSKLRVLFNEKPEEKEWPEHLEVDDPFSPEEAIYSKKQIKKFLGEK